MGDAFINYTYPLYPVLEIDGERCRGHASPPAIDPPPWPPSKVPTREGLELAVAKLTCETAKRLVSLRPSPKSIGASFRSKREDGDSLILRTIVQIPIAPPTHDATTTMMMMVDLPMPLLDELLLSDCADAVDWVEEEVVVVVGEVDGAETVEVRVMFSRSVAELEAGTELELESELAWPEERVEVNVV